MSVAVVALTLVILALLPDGAGPRATTHAGHPEGAEPEDSAFTTVSRAIPLQTKIDLGPEPKAKQTAAANARLALIGGGQYLLNSLDAETPEQLAQAVRIFATNLQDIGMNALAGLDIADPEQVAQMAEGDTTRLLIADLCE